MKKLVLIASLFFGATAFAQDCSELFISEYVEGWSNNKALEIYNPTASAIDLSNYFLVRYSNGNTSPTAQNMVQLNGSVPPYDVYVAVLDKRDTSGTGQNAPVWDSLQVRADGFYCPDYNVSNSMYFNGNDAMVLYKGNMASFSSATVVDVFGKIGEDPGDGWTTQAPYTGTGTGPVVTQDHSLIRHQNIKKGVTNPNVQEFNALIEWDSLSAVVVRLDQNGDTIYAQSGNPRLDGNWYSLGWHACDCSPFLSIKENENKLENVQIYPNPSETGTVYIKINTAIKSIKISNTLGQVIEVLNNVDVNNLMPVNLQKSGFYFVTIQSKEGKITTKRVIVK